MGKVSMEHSKRQSQRPVPRIDVGRCDGCGLCVQVCPTQALAIKEATAIVARPDACEYSGICEMVCPHLAIQRPFEIVQASAPRIDVGAHQNTTDEGGSS
jgi:NAD-dependent dihydropyrimidine dehydrogenase PreA subunit